MKANHKKLQIAMARACMNLQDLAKASDLPPQTVNGALRGRGIRPGTIGKIAKALDCDVTEILEEDPTE